MLFFSFIFLLIASISSTVSAEEAMMNFDHSQGKQGQTLLLAGGCFWCLEHDLEATKGVHSAISGYSGGERPNPTYENSHLVTAAYPTAHVETVKVNYDPVILPRQELLRYYFRHIDATDGGGQFYDRGPQYRPVIFVNNEAEKADAIAIKAESEALLGQPLKVEILPAVTFYPAEEYHQDYSQKNTLRYKAYRNGSGRDQKIKNLWDGAEQKE